MRKSGLGAALGVFTLVAAFASMPANAGNGSAVGAGLVGLGVGAIIGSTLAPREVYVVPPPPPPVYYAPVAYGPPAWSPEWYGYCSSRYPTFNPGTGYFIAPNGAPVFCR